MKKFFSTIIIVLIHLSAASSQSPDSYFQQTLYTDANHVLGVSSGLLTAPFKFSENDWQNTVYTIAATTALFFIDQDVKRFAQSKQSKLNNKIFKIDDYLNGQTGMYTAAGLYSTGFLIKNNKIRQMGLHAWETILLATSVTSFLKYSFGRARPYNGNNQMDFRAFRGSRERYRAFPSGHTTSAFALASVMAMSLDNIYWKAFWYSSATMVGAARIYHNNHWLSDTFLAGVISYSIAHYVVHYGSSTSADDHTYKIQMYPFHLGAGLRISF